MIIKIETSDDKLIPKYAHEGDAGMDLRANIAEPLVVTPGNRVMVPTGLYMEIEPGYEVQIRPRSGLAFKHGVTVLNSPGTIDSGYRDEVRVILINHNRYNNFVIKPYDRIAQMVVHKVEKAEIVLGELSEDTDRGLGGFGSTGVE